HFIEHLAITLSPPLEITIVRLPGQSWRLEGVGEVPCCRHRHWGSRGPLDTGNHASNTFGRHQQLAASASSAPHHASPPFAVSPSRAAVPPPTSSPWTGHPRCSSSHLSGEIERPYAVYAHALINLVGNPSCRPSHL
ncbi:Os06g0202600, partial [Oryza sativa Japonica Group]